MRKEKLLLLVCLFVISASAAAKGWFYQSLTGPAVPPSDFVCIHIQENSYSWGGTKNGLFRYGYNDEYRWYEADGGETSIPDGYVLNLESDPDGRLWVFTAKGIAIYDELSDSFRQLMYDTEGGPVNLVGYCSLQAEDGKFYIGGKNVLYVYDLQADMVLQTIPFSPGAPFRIDDLIPAGRKNEFGLFNRKLGFYVYHTDTGEIVKGPENIVDNYAYLMDSRGVFWCSKYNRGVECYGPDGSLIRTYTTENSDLSSNLVTSFLENKGAIWIGTDGGGINILRPDDGSMLNLERNDKMFNSFPCNSVLALCADASNSVWAIRSDVSALVLREVYMRSVPVAPVYDQSGRMSDEVLCFSSVAGSDSKVWVGTASSGLYMFDRSTLNSDLKLTKVESVGNHKIESMVTMTDGRLLMSFASEGLFLYNPRTDRLSAFTAIKDRDFYDSIKFEGETVSLGLDSSNHVRIMSRNVYVWIPETGEIFLHNVPWDRKVETVYPVSHGSGKYYYSDHHLYVWDSSIRMHAEVFNVGPDIRINSATIDSSGIFWLATDCGVYCLTKDTSKMKRLELAGIPSAEVVIADAVGRIWIATYSALYVYLPQLNNVMRFSDNDGANRNRYNGKAWFYSDDNILLGGTNGMLVLDHTLDFYVSDEPEIVIQDVILDGGRLDGNPGRITISSLFKTLELNVFAKEKNILRSKMFRYSIKGAYNNVIETDLPSVEFTMLPPGKHTVCVSCTLQNGDWSEPKELLTINVLPVWYRSWWFWLIIAAILLSMLVLLIHSIKADADFKMALAESEAENKAGQDSLRFLLNVSHELKTPLTLIISPLSRILKNKDKSDPEYSVLSNIYRQANRMSSLILTVLDSHKIQDGSASLNAEKTDMNSWVERYVSDFDDEADSRSIKLLRSFDPHVGDADIDSPKLENVITNMMINALKHSPDGTTITVGTKFQRENGTVRVFVADEGEGLGGVDMTKLFSRFYQGYAQKTGSGLGLAYANSIVEIHHGTMGACDNEKAGATFYFDIPAMERPAITPAGEKETVSSVLQPLGEQESAAVEGESAPAKRTFATSLADATVLVVDDDMDLREYLVEELSMEVHEVHSAPNGRKALDFIMQHHVDVVVSDVMMPLMDGFELCSKIKADVELKKIPVILLTARAESKSREQGLSIGANDYISKPFAKDDLVGAISKLLEKN